MRPSESPTSQPRLTRIHRLTVSNVTSERCAKSGRARRSENRFPSFGRWTRRCCWTLVHAQSEVSEGASERLGMQSPPAVLSREYPAAAPNRGAAVRRVRRTPKSRPSASAETCCHHLGRHFQGGGTGSNPVGGTPEGPAPAGLSAPLGDARRERTARVGRWASSREDVEAWCRLKDGIGGHKKNAEVSGGRRDPEVRGVAVLSGEGGQHVCNRIEAEQLRRSRHR